MISTTLEFEQQITIEELLHDFDKYGVPIYEYYNPGSGIRVKSVSNDYNVYEDRISLWHKDNKKIVFRNVRSYGSTRKC